ncbi:SGNH/GDSL hydrolase family protein [Aliikangiella marina]|nr:SGNH/GDSL hydrolase family protein [Aliikangiella marina]
MSVPVSSERLKWIKRKVLVANEGEFIVKCNEFKQSKRILAEGDSWFSYPLGGGASNIILQLNSLYRPKDATILRKSSNGDEIAQMFAGNQKLENIQLLRDIHFDYFLVSGGGNDIVGVIDFELIVKKSNKAEPQPADFFNQELLNLRLDTIIMSYRNMLAYVRKFSKNKKIQIISHTYAYPRIKKGAKVLGLIEVGPWIAPFTSGIIPAAHHFKAIDYLIDQMAERLLALADAEDNFHVIDTRKLVKANQWNDEIHPTDKGFETIGQKFKEKIDSL